MDQAAGAGHLDPQRWTRGVGLVYSTAPEANSGQTQRV